MVLRVCVEVTGRNRGGKVKAADLTTFHSFAERDCALHYSSKELEPSAHIGKLPIPSMTWRVIYSNRKPCPWVQAQESEQLLWWTPLMGTFCSLHYLWKLQRRAITSERGWERKDRQAGSKVQQDAQWQVNFIFGNAKEWYKTSELSTIREEAERWVWNKGEQKEKE